MSNELHESAFRQSGTFQAGLSKLEWMTGMALAGTSSWDVPKEGAERAVTIAKMALKLIEQEETGTGTT